ncbi:MAG: universal stress protein, partial [Anaerolineae bacterium]
RLGRDIGRTIIEAAEEREANLLMLGWRGYARSRGVLLGRVLDRVIEETPCDVAVVRDRGLSHVERILVPTAGGPNATLAAEIAIALAKEYDGKVTALYICRSGREAEVEHARRVIDQTLAGLESDRPLEPRVIAATDVVQGVLAEAEEHDLVVLGATREGLFQQLLVGNVPETIARRCHKTVIIVKRHAGPIRSWLRRLWGRERR